MFGRSVSMPGGAGTANSVAKDTTPLLGVTERAEAPPIGSNEDKFQVCAMDHNHEEHACCASGRAS